MPIIASLATLAVLRVSKLKILFDSSVQILCLAFDTSKMRKTKLIPKAKTNVKLKKHLDMSIFS